MRRGINRTNQFILSGLLIIIFVGPGFAADSEDRFDYDIFWIGDTLTCWLDPTPALTQQKMEDLLAGLDIYFQFDIKLEKPRKLLFMKNIIHRQAALLISHQLTEDLYRVRFSGTGNKEYEFESQLQVSDFLADSVVFELADRTLIEDAGNPRLALTISCKSLHPRGFSGEQEGLLDSLSPGQSGQKTVFDEAFGLFLDLIGFGKANYKVVSPIFNPNNLDSINR
ncbi:MAG: DUF4390 domain-containing protein [FCB group bacterium]|nr:DUF4390 domain-containing protein [FCB group bacterium]